MKLCDIGKMYGRWLVVERVKRPENKARGLYYLCECQCQAKTRRTVHGRTLRNGTSKSCGCNCQHKGKSEVGEKYGRWQVIEMVSKPSHRKGRGLYFLCECQCNTRRIIAGNHLRQGISTNCGCARREIRNVEAPYNVLMSSYKHNAKKRGISFHLTIQNIKEITQKDCFYCGMPPSAKLGWIKSFEKHNFVYSGIDRVDSRNGYSKANCVSCCKKCNTAKMGMPLKEFDDWLCAAYACLQERKISLLSGGN